MLEDLEQTTQAIENIENAEEIIEKLLVSDNAEMNEHLEKELNEISMLLFLALCHLHDCVENT